MLILLLHLSLRVSQLQRRCDGLEVAYACLGGRSPAFWTTSCRRIIAVYVANVIVLLLLTLHVVIAAVVKVAAVVIIISVVAIHHS